MRLRLATVRVALLLASAGCSRFGFESYPLPDGGTPDADGAANDAVDGDDGWPGLPCTTSADCHACADCVNGFCQVRNPALSLAAGRVHACAVDSSGGLYCWGSNAYGQISGTDPSQSLLVPTLVGIRQDWIQVDAGNQHTCAVTRDGMLYCWGDNSEGQLGLGDSVPHLHPERVGPDADWKQVAVSCGLGLFTCGLKTNGALYCWGQNHRGQLGLGEALLGQGQNVPRQVGTDRDWTLLETGNDTVHAIRQDGSLWSWGENAEGQLGIGSWQQVTVPSPVAGAESYSRVAAGAHHTCASTRTGQVYCWGNDTDGEVGQGGDTSLDPDLAPLNGSFQDIGCGQSHTLAVSADGSMWGFGNNGHGELGLGEAGADQLVPARATGQDWVRVTCGEYFSCGLQRDGSVWCTGLGTSGQLGQGNQESAGAFRVLCLE